MDLSQKKEVLPVATLLFWKFCFSLRTSYKELIWYTSNPNAYVTSAGISLDSAFSLWVSLKEIPDTFEELTFKIVKSIPFVYKRVDIATDSYHPNSIKMPESQTRGLSSKIYIKSSKSRLPRNFANFLSNGENKQIMDAIMFSTLERKKSKILNYLKTNQLIISKQNLCKSITLSTVRIVENLLINQKETDTILIMQFLSCIDTLSKF